MKRASLTATAMWPHRSKTITSSQAIGMFSIMSVKLFQCKYLQQATPGHSQEKGVVRVFWQIGIECTKRRLARERGDEVLKTYINEDVHKSSCKIVIIITA